MCTIFMPHSHFTPFLFSKAYPELSFIISHYKIFGTGIVMFHGPLGNGLRQTQNLYFSLFRVLGGETNKIQVHHTFISNTTHSTFTQSA